MQESLQKLQELLQKLFRADAADLDFGIYRIINYRRDQLQNFIDEELPAIVQHALDANTETESAREELEDLKKRIKDQYLRQKWTMLHKFTEAANFVKTARRLWSVL